MNMHPWLSACVVSDGHWHLAEPVTGSSNYNTKGEHIWTQRRRQGNHLNISATFSQTETELKYSFETGPSQKQVRWGDTVSNLSLFWTILKQPPPCGTHTFKEAQRSCFKLTCFFFPENYPLRRFLASLYGAYHFNTFSFQPFRFNRSVSTFNCGDGTAATRGAPGTNQVAKTCTVLTKGQRAGTFQWTWIAV